MSNKNRNKEGIVYSTDPGFTFGDLFEHKKETPALTKQKLKVSLERKHRGGKIVTLVAGFIGREEDLENLGKMLKSYCGCGGSVKDGEIIIQGDQVAKVIARLQAEGYQVKKSGI